MPKYHKGCSVKNIFREYDIRGIYSKELNEQSVKLIGFFLGKIIKKRGGNAAVGYDAREHSPILRDWLVSGLNYAGCRVYDMGLVPTPVNYFSNYIPQKSEDGSQIEINGSIMITGSHNPKEYNGFKITIDKMPFYGSDIYTLGKEVEQNLHLKIPTDTSKTKIDTKNQYINYMIEQFNHLKGLDKKIVIDCGNGVAGVVLQDIFNALNFNFKPLYCEPDGTFPNHHPDPSVEENLQDLILALKGRDLGFAYDGDADRIAVLTPKHNIKGDQLALILSLGIKNPTVIGEVKCSKIMYDELKRRGAKAIMYKTGHSNLKMKMQETNADLACEVSGHIFFKHRYFGYDDAIYATLRVLELVKEGVNLDKEIESLPKLFSTDELKIDTTDSAKFKIIEEIKNILKNPPKELPEIIDIITIDGLRINFSNGWALVRASNTTPILVTRFEADTKENLTLYINQIQKIIDSAKTRVENRK